jgi:hypothetical protein
VYFVSETTQVELTSGRVYAPAGGALPARRDLVWARAYWASNAMKSSCEA